MQWALDAMVTTVGEVEQTRYRSGCRFCYGGECFGYASVHLEEGTRKRAVGVEDCELSSKVFCQLWIRLSRLLHSKLRTDSLPASPYLKLTLSDAALCPDRYARIRSQEGSLEWHDPNLMPGTEPRPSPALPLLGIDGSSVLIRRITVLN